MLLIFEKKNILYLISIIIFTLLTYLSPCDKKHINRYSKINE